MYHFGVDERLANFQATVKRKQPLAPGIQPRDFPADAFTLYVNS